MKTCVKCGATRELDEFGRPARNKDGRESRCLPCTRAERNASYARHRKSVRAYQIAYKYGSTAEGVDALFESQAGCCAICKVGITLEVGNQNASAHVDHCHATGRVRGLLCNSCNRGIG